MRWAFASRSALALTLFAMGAQANDDAAAAIAKGLALRRQHMDLEALAEFRRAYELEPSARALAQVALAEGALARWVPAESDLLRALAAEDEWVDRQRGVLQLAMKEIQSHLSTLEIAGPDGAEVWVDGASVARLPAQPLRVAAKHLVVELRAPGFHTAHRDVDAEAGGIFRETMDLQRVEPAPPVLAASALPTATSGEPRRSPGAGSAAWISGGAATLFLAGGIASTLYASDRATRYNGDASCNAQAAAAHCASYAQDLGVAKGAEIATYSVAGATAVASTMLFALPTGDSDADRRSELRTIAWGLAGGAAAFLADGIVSTIYASDRASRFNGDPRCLTQGIPSYCITYASQVGTAQALAVAGYTATGVSATTSLMLFLASKPGGEPSSSRLRCLPVVGGVACRYDY
jgi:hypothetical protein